MVDYSKWKNIEVSDDEDDTHPNIDTPSLFRWRHQARVERMEQHKKEQLEHDKKKAENARKLSEFKTKLAAAENTSKPINVKDLQQKLKQLEMEEQELKKKEDDMRKKEKNTPWNVDTISKPGFEKTVINKRVPRNQEENLTEEEKSNRMKTFIKENEKNLKHFGMLKKYDDSKVFLKSHTHLVGENTANYLVIWCMNLEMEEKHELMEHVAHQTICMQYMLELAKQLDCDPRACIDVFFNKIQVAEPEYKRAFEDELKQFKERIRKRSAEKLKELAREVEEEERQQRLGPGGLDPVEVFESLPDNLKKCFETQDIQMLQDTIAQMDEQQAKYHMKRCVDSGLWVPEPSKPEDETAESTTPTTTTTNVKNDK